MVLQYAHVHGQHIDRPIKAIGTTLQELSANKNPAPDALSRFLDTAPDFDASKWHHAQQRIIRGALQITASRLLGQSTQERNGQNELHDGIGDLERARAARQARALGRRNE
jgi:hypothetical protein